MTPPLWISGFIAMDLHFWDCWYALPHLSANHHHDPVHSIWSRSSDQGALNFVGAAMTFCASEYHGIIILCGYWYYVTWLHMRNKRY